MSRKSGAPGGPAAACEWDLVARVLERMRERGGFPALDHSVAQIVDAIEQGKDDIAPLVNAVLADVSLTQKVLRLANSAMYASIGRNISTITHAMMVLGFEAVGHLALGVKLIGSMEELNPPSQSAERELAHSLVAGSVAGSVVGRLRVKNGEMGVVCTLLHRIGRLLAAFYLPEEWRLVQDSVKAGDSEVEAARRVLGMSLEELGRCIASQWGLPVAIVQTMRTEVEDAEEGGNDWLLALTRFSDQAAGLLAAGTPEDAHRKQRELAERYGSALGAAPGELFDAVSAAAEEATAHPLLAGILAERADAADAIPPADPLSKLASGLAEIREAIADHAASADVLQMVLEVGYSSLNLGRAAILVLDGERQVYRVRATMSTREPNRLAGLALPIQSGQNLAQIALSRKVDVYIDNPRDFNIAAHLPAWVRAYSLHPFFLFPMVSGGGDPIGLFYGQQQDDTKLGMEELKRLAELRDLLQARLAEDRAE
jgi:HD-like signal output (HDOD) protein